MTPSSLPLAGRAGPPAHASRAERAMRAFEASGEGVVVQRTIPMSGATEVLVRLAEAGTVAPGQFFQIAVGAPHALLRRPYSAAWSNPDTGDVAFIFNVVGLGSDWLSRRKEGDHLHLLGPLGHGFDLEGDGDAICIAGGLGIAVFPGVVQALLQRKRRVIVLHGARTAAQLLGAERFSGASVLFATDDGSAGHRGSVVDLLRTVLSESFPRPCAEGHGGNTDIFACGPTPMLQALIREGEHSQIPRASIQIALETPMGCGVGTCLGCVAPQLGGGYLLTCQQGPCVRADQLDWNRMTDTFHG